MKVTEVMISPVVSVSEDDSLEEVARLMLKHRIGCVPVVNEKGELAGIITESDFTAKNKGFPFSTFRAPELFGQWLDEVSIERIYEAARTRKAKEIMRRQVVTVTEDGSVRDVLECMLRCDVTRIPVVRNGVPVGMIARHDMLKLMARIQEEPPLAVEKKVC